VSASLCPRRHMHARRVPRTPASGLSQPDKVAITRKKPFNRKSLLQAASRRRAPRDETGRASGAQTPAS